MPKRKSRPSIRYIPVPMKQLLFYGCFDDSDMDLSFEPWVISIHPEMIVKEWQGVRDQLYPSWTHEDIEPYAECLLQGIEPDREALKAIYAKEIKA